MKRKKILIFFTFFSFIVICIIFQKISLAATFVESFIGNDYIDSANTTADWETSTTTAHLINGEWRQLDGATSPYVFKEEAVTGFTAPKPDIIHDANNQPLIVFDQTIDTTMSATKWSVGAGTSVCGAGVTDCWTDLSGTTKGLHNSVFNLPGGDYVNRKRIGRLKNGYPAVIFSYYSVAGSYYELHYMQWTPNAADGVCSSGNSCWTNAAKTAEGSEKISNNNMTALSNFYKSFDLVMDQYEQPNIVWNEYDGTNLSYHYTRWNGSNWTNANRTTTGKQQLTTKVSSDNADLEFIIKNGVIYVVLRYDDYNYVGKWNGSNWVNLADTTFTNYSGMTIFKAANNLNIGIGQNRKRNYLMVENNQLYLGISSYTTGTADNYLAYWDNTVDTWKYINGTTIGNNQTAIDNMNELFNGESWDLHELYMVNLSVDKKTNNILMLMSNYDGASSELYFSQWDGSNWKQPDGDTDGYEVASNLVYGGNYNTYSSIAIDNYGKPIFSYVDRAYTSPNKNLPLYISKFNGSDITGVNDYTANRDLIADDNQNLSTGLYYQSLYFNQATEEIYFAGMTGDGGMLITKFFANKYPDQDQDVVSDTIAVPYNSASEITSATLVAEHIKPSGTDITYYLSADGGSNWESVTSGVAHNFTNTGDDLRWKANFTSSSEDSTPTIQYLYIDVDGKTKGTSGDIIITAEIIPSLSLNINSTTCDFGVFSDTNIKTCSYVVTVSTNASAGYMGYIQEDQDLQTINSKIITDVDDSAVTGGGTGIDEEYGLSTSDSSQEISENNTGLTCAQLNNQSSTAMPATPLTTDNQTFVTSTLPVASEETTLCHSAAIISNTPAGSYSHSVTITVVGNF